MSKNTTKLVLIFIIFITSLSSSIPTLAAPKAADIAITVTNQVDPLISDNTKKQLRIVNHSGLIIIPKAQPEKIETAKISIKDAPKSKVKEKIISAKKTATITAQNQNSSRVVAQKEPKKELQPESQTETQKLKPAAELPQKSPATAKNLAPSPEPINLDQASNQAKKAVLNVDQVKELIRQNAQKYDQDPDLMLRLADCESRFEVNVVTAGKYFGVYQFSKATFEQYSKELKIQNPDPLNPEQNIEVAAYMIQNGQLARWGCKV